MGQTNHDKNVNGGGIQLSDDHVTRVVQKSATDKGQFVKSQDSTVRPKMPPFDTFLVEGPPRVCMASSEKMYSYLEKVSESSDKGCHRRRAKKKLKLITPSEPDFVEGTSYAFEHVKVAADQVFYIILLFFFSFSFFSLYIRTFLFFFFDVTYS